VDASGMITTANNFQPQFAEGSQLFDYCTKLGGIVCVSVQMA
jgi:hypothetical protein